MASIPTPQRASPNLRSEVGNPPPLGLADWIGIALTIALLLCVSWLHSRHTIFWSDEVMGWLVTREPTVRQLLHSWWAGADSSGIVFYLFARPWLALFGATPLALRLFTATGVALAAALLWITGRRFFRVEIVAAILPATLFAHPTLVWQLANSRTYGILLASVALAALTFALTDPDLQPPGAPVPARLLALTFLAHLCLVGSHILGPLYSALLLAGLVARDLWQTGRLRPGLYLAGAAGWLSLLISLPNIRSTMALGKPSFWALKPYRHELALGFTAFQPHLRLAGLLLLALTVVVWLARERRLPRAPFFPRADRTRLALLLTLFSCVPAIFLISRITTPIFVDRYLLPVLFADILFLCELAGRLLVLLSAGPRLRLGLLAVMLVVLAGIVRHDLPLHPGDLPLQDYTAGLAALIPPNTPAVLTDPGNFAEMVFYQNRSATLLTPVDWPVVLASRNSGAVPGAHEMDNWKSLGYFSRQIQPTAQILTENPRFLVIAPASTGAPWLDRRVLGNPRWQVIDLGVHPEAGLRFHLWQVTRRP